MIRIFDIKKAKKDLKSNDVNIFNNYISLSRLSNDSIL